MLKQENRLRKKRDFEEVFKKGKTKTGKNLFLKARKNKLKTNRFGWVVSLKVSKKAVVRNKIKRQLRAIVKKNFSNLKQGLDIVVVARPEIVNKNYQEIENDLESLLKIL